MKFRAALAILGLVMSGSLTVLLCLPSSSNVTKSLAHGARSAWLEEWATASSNDPRSFECGGLLQYWSWRTPEELRVGDTGQVAVRCELRRYYYKGVIQPSDENLREFAINSGELVPFTSPLKVSISGPFECDPALEQTSGLANSTIAEWSWLITAVETGNKAIQLSLPPNVELNVDRAFADDSTDSKDFVVLPILVKPRHLLADPYRSAVSIFAWVVGPAFTAPWIFSLIRQSRKKKSKSSLILPSHLEL